ncbi:MAG: DUF87 domain-containing protein [Candidatus Promineifilaceae bacterium]|nr:DUF87 domain-containing protein [Candidatus Promineifilaceae bacterium]
MLDTDGKFFLGRITDPVAGDATDEMLLYDGDDLTTHALVVGMTGSGKTGLCIDLLEETALNNIPALMIDPKGDITNTLLHFPDLLPADFAPWINVDEARRQGKTVDEVAQKTADLWRNGLSGWNIGRERIQALKDSVQFAVYTPGSDAGLPISILASLAAPDIPWSGNEELLREQIAGTVTALLGLTGMTDIDPVQSREHILLSTIFENAWSQGKDLDLGELIMQTQSPPFEKLGFFDVNTFFPEKDRFKLAMNLNNIVASPGFQSWLEGEALDIENLMVDKDGRARHTVFYIAHLNDDERMFFVTLLFSAVETWMRTKRGTGSLRALVYFDEIFGYLPPIGNPPSKEPMLRMLKQARAFGVGLVLASQNPVDIDYKAMSNAGTWFIGKLGTEQDKNRLLDGLTSASGAGLSRSEYDKLISSIGKRVFLMRNVHEKAPALFHTRWAMNYLAGPMTRTQIPALNQLADVGAPEPAVAPGPAMAAATAAAAATVSQVDAAPVVEPEAALELPGTRTRAAVPGTVGEYFLPATQNLTDAVQQRGRSIPIGAEEHGILYRPTLLAQADILYVNRKYNLDHEIQVTVLVEDPHERGHVRWDEYRLDAIDSRAFSRGPVPQARFAALEQPLSDSRKLKSLKTDYADWIYGEVSAAVKANETLKVYAGPDVDEEDFEEMCLEAADEKQEQEIDKLEASYKRKIESLEKRLKREERELREDEADLERSKQEEMTSYAETVFSFFGGRKKSLSSAMSKRGKRARAKEDVEESIEEIAEIKEDMAELEDELKEAVAEIEEKWAEIAADVSEIRVSPYKKNIDVNLFGVAWFPYYMVQVGDDIQEFPAFNVVD